MKTYDKGDRIPVRAQQMWLILTAQAVLKPDGDYEEGAGWSGWGRGIISYGGLAIQMGMNPKAGVTFQGILVCSGSTVSKKDYLHSMQSL